MRELAILTFVTLDGVMQSPSSSNEDPSGGFKHGGWARPYWVDVMQHVKKEAMASPYDLLLGRQTYDIFAAHFPNSDDSSSNPMNEATKYVATTSPNTLAWNNSIPVTGNIASEVSRLKKQGGPLMQVHGSSRLIQTLLLHGLIDEYRIWTFPVVVGNGKRLFGETASTELTLVKTEACTSGPVMSIYRNAKVA